MVYGSPLFIVAIAFLLLVMVVAIIWDISNERIGAGVLTALICCVMIMWTVGTSYSG